MVKLIYLLNLFMRNFKSESLIIGFGRVGKGLLYYTDESFYILKRPQDTTLDSFSICIKNSKNCYNNFYYNKRRFVYINSSDERFKTDFNNLIISVYEDDLDKLLESYDLINKNIKNIYLVCNNPAPLTLYKEKFPDQNVYGIVVENGFIKVNSEFIYIVNSIKKICIIHCQSLNESNTIFTNPTKSRHIEINDPRINEVFFTRYLKTVLSILAVFYRADMQGLFQTNTYFISKIVEELNLLLHTDFEFDSIKTEILKDISSSEYYGSSYYSYNIEDKLFNWHYFFKSLTNYPEFIETKYLKQMYEIADFTIMTKIPPVEKDWFQSEKHFFGKYYEEADNSIRGYNENDLEFRTLNEIKGILQLLNLDKNTKILDAPCGYGRHSTQLANLGYDVTGLDINDYNKTERNFVFIKEDLRKYSRQDYFDAVINMFYSFGFFYEETDNLRVLKNFYLSLKKGGKVLIHTHIFKERYFYKNLKTSEIRDLNNGKKLFLKRFYNNLSEREEGVWEIYDNSELTNSAGYSMRIYSKNEYVELLEEVGFKNIETFSTFNGQKFLDTDCELIIIGEK